MCLALLVHSWLIALQTEEAPPAMLAASSPSGSLELFVRLEGCEGISTGFKLTQSTIPTTEDEDV